MWEMLNKLAIIRLWRLEFENYSAVHFRSDLLAGLTVAAVALPLALAFGVSSGATAAAGLVTAIVSGFVIGALSGAPYQISGPTGAMSAVLIIVVQKYGLPGLWLASLMAGAIILALGIFKLGRIINFVPAPVITGFTSGIALIIFIGQIDNLLGVKTPAADSATYKVIGYFTNSLPTLNWQAIGCGAIVIVTMLLLSRFRQTTRLPAALIGLILATAVAWLVGWNVATIGKIPSTVLPAERFNFSWDALKGVENLLGPAAAIAALGSIESLLAGVVAGRMTGIKMNANQELVAQGIGNMILPFFGGVPATAAIARISVALKAGGITRLVSFVHSVALLGSALFLSELLARIPLAALAGVLMITAWRMNEWHVIRFYFKRRLKSPITIFLVTMLATVTLDLTQAIIIGIILSLLLFINQVSQLDLVVTDVDWERLEKAGHAVPDHKHKMKIIYISGSLYFGAVGQLLDKLDSLGHVPVLILSMRGVPIIDTSGLHAVEHIWEKQTKHGGLLYITGLQQQVRRMFVRSGLVEAAGEDKFLWSADQAINSASTRLTSAPTVNEWEAEDAITNQSSDDPLNEMPFGIQKVE